jgi:transcriptional regulator with XRE-family HTH domain
MNITEKIIALRNSKRMKSSEIANILEMNHSNYLRIEKRDKELTLNQLEQIATALGVTLDELLHYGEPVNGGVDVGALQAKISSLEKELELLKRELAVTQKELSLTKQQTTKKYNGRWLKATDKDIGLFIKRDKFLHKIRANHLIFTFLHEDEQFGYLVNTLFDKQDISLDKEYHLYLFFTINFIEASYNNFFISKIPLEDSQGEKFKYIENFTTRTKEEIKEIFDYCYHKYIDVFIENFKKDERIALFLEVGLLDLEGFTDKWRYATSLGNFRILFNSYAVETLIDPPKYVDFDKYLYFDITE